MTRKVEMLRAALPAAVGLHYAIKANPMPPSCSHLAGLVDGLDVASAGELHGRARHGRAAAPRSVSRGRARRMAELERAVAAGIVINMESQLEMRRLADLALRSGSRPRVAVRVNPDFELKSSGMKMAGGPKQFGVDAERVPALLAELAALPLEFWGFHIFSGSQNLRPEILIEAQQKSAALAFELARSAPAPVRLLNLGGGFGIPYFPGEKPLDLAPIGANLRELAAAHRGASCPMRTSCSSSAAILVGEAGVYVCRVVDRKISRGHVFLITDGGLHHHLAASGNFGQVLRKNYPVLVANRIGAGPREHASVVGPLCTPLDLLADRMELDQAREVDDLIAVFQSGAYGLTASPLGFLSHPPPLELLL